METATCGALARRTIGIVPEWLLLGFITVDDATLPNPIFHKPENDVDSP